MQHPLFRTAASVSFICGLALCLPSLLANSPEPVARPTPDLAAAKPAVAASNAFGIDLYRALANADPGRNLCISPYSVSVALTMAAEGARGETESQMAAALRFPADGRTAGRPITQIHTGHAALAQHFAAAAGNTDPKTRERIKRLRKELDSANAATAKLQREQKWNEAGESQRRAESLASELNGLLSAVDRFDLRVANALWVEQTFDLVPAYVQTIDRFYGSGGVSRLNIAGDTEKSRRFINAWVESNTENRIKDLIPQGALTPAIRLVITNAVYFMGEWVAPFAEGSTRDDDFTLADGTKVKTKMMNDPWRGWVSYAAFTAAGECFQTPIQVPRDESQRPAVYPGDDGFSMIELPYKGGDLSMVLIAPRSPQGLAALESRLTAESLDAWLAKMAPRAVDTAMPKFKLEYTQELSGPLRSLGMKRAFISPEQPGGAEFPGMSDSADPARQLFIGAVLHKAWVEVTEKGTEAAAATAVLMAPGAAARPVEMVPFTPRFHADHPFIFLIRDTKSGVILFIGRMTRPAA